MKTTNFSIDLMIPSQLNKDVVFNESLLKIDSFMNLSVIDFVSQKPERLMSGEKFIISDGEHKNKICYKPLESKSIMIHEPKLGMVVFVIKEYCFFILDNNGWKKINITSEKLSEPNIQKHFTGIDRQFSVPTAPSCHYLYLNSNTEIRFEETIYPHEISIIIKQAYNGTHDIKWASNILWENKKPHSMTQTQNAIDLIKLYQLPETHHLLGKIVAQNFNY